MLKNSSDRYGLIAVLMHWVIAALIIGLFVMGVWMRELGYYDPWYHRAPELHKSIGLLVLLLFAVRLCWRFYDPAPPPSQRLAKWERVASRFVHVSLYALSLVIIASGYLIATADNVGVSFFGWFEVPAGFTAFEHQEDIAGEIHKILAWLTMGLVLLHTAASLKHHYIDKDSTLVRMLGLRRRGNDLQ